MTTPSEQPPSEQTPQPRDIALELPTPGQTADLEAQSDPDDADRD
ncbi:hypothetical protein SAMN06893096_10452 [Geodermatophilus pulveris]|uniref:Uncharacterized protein n=1 Tax=Geodermatophilus pulveris TaxID=1564159 RepID=A0A239ED45_9ACTN|nr:hypothetical protein [Geodermatophilus pulveris]SNS42371.1 hypothetical protein SAMN06893096_10452 [Geodermatophilus pulveris]